MKTINNKGVTVKTEYVYEDLILADATIEIAIPEASYDEAMQDMENAMRNAGFFYPETWDAKATYLGQTVKRINMRSVIGIA